MTESLRKRIARQIYAADPSVPGNAEDYAYAAPSVRERYEHMAVAALAQIHDEAIEEPTELSRGWSVSVGELRDAIRGIPAETEVMLTNAEVGDCEIASLSVESRLYATSDSPGLLVLQGGQVVTSEYDFHRRLDDSFAAPTRPMWDEDRKEWGNR